MILSELSSQQIIILLLTVVGVLVGVYFIMTDEMRDPQHESYLLEKERSKLKCEQTKDDDTAVKQNSAKRQSSETYY